MIVRSNLRRTGATAVETAVVFGVMCVMIVGILVGGNAVFRYQQVASLANEGTRWASVRGSEYQKDNKSASPTKQEIIDKAILPVAVGFNASDLEVTVEWIDKSTGIAYDWDVAAKDIRSMTSTGEYVSNAVRVTVIYRWNAGFSWSPITLTGISELTMTN